jgi:hypothetical protein
VRQAVRETAEEPARYDRLSINRGPADKFLLDGAVDSQADFDALRDRFVGEERADFVMGTVEVRYRTDADRP